MALLSFRKRPKLALLVVDVSKAWEEVLKAHERGFGIEWTGNGFKRDHTVENVPLDLEYPHGSVRAGFNAIIDAVWFADARHVPIFAVHTGSSWHDGEEVTCDSLQPYIPEERQAYKGGYSAFIDPASAYGEGMAAKLERLVPESLFVLGYDRDYCVLETAKDAVARGYRVITSEYCMLTKNRPEKLRDISREFYQDRTTHLESLVDVLNFINQNRN